MLQGETEKHTLIHTVSLSLCFKELDLLIEDMLMNLQFEGNNNTLYRCELLPSQGQNKRKNIPLVGD